MKRLKQIVSKATSVTMSLFLLASGLPGRTQASFTKITTGPVVTDVEQSTGCAWGDYNNDGLLDLFVANFNTNRNTLYRNNGNGTFSRFTAGAPGNELPAFSGGGVWGDYDNDGFLDLFVANLSSTTMNWLYRNNGNGTFQKMTGAQAGPIVSNLPNRSVSSAWGDFDVDGNLDLFVANGAFVGNRVSALYRNLGQGRFANIAATSGMNQALMSTQGTWADVDGDCRLDLFVTHAANQGNYIYRNLGGGAFQTISSGNVLNERLSSVGSAWGDYDNDGDLDLFVVNRDLGGGTWLRNNFYRNNGNGIFETIATGDIVNDSGAFNSCAWADYDNDGYLDLFVTNEGLGNRLYHNNGGGTFSRVTEGDIVTDIADSNGCSWGDIDNDGFLDLFIANGGIISPQPNFLYRNNGNSNHWIKVRCVGTVSNRSAIGAVVRAKALIDGAVRWQMRQISGGDGWVSQSSLDVSIGFGNATNIDLLRIEWPSGIVQEFQNVAVDQTLVIVEKTTLEIAKRSETDFEIKVTGPRQQRYSLETSTDLNTWSPLTSLTITNADGTAIVQGALGSEPARYFRAAAQ